MKISIHFRGVAVVVANSPDGTATEVLFPKADEGPPDGKPLVVLDPDVEGRKLTEILRHADGSVANRHFAGALLVNSDGTRSYHRLSGRRVQRAPQSGGSGIGARIAHDFVLPPLDDIIVDPTKKLKLLKDRPKSRVATQFILNGDSINANLLTKQQWKFSEPNGERDPQDYSLDATWTIEADSVVFNIDDLAGGGVRETIELGDACPEVFFYNFDNALPSRDELLTTEKAKANEVDDDFKWAYKLFDKDASSWPEWLDGGGFPAPVQFGGLLPISTCFELVWTGADA